MCTEYTSYQQRYNEKHAVEQVVTNSVLRHTNKFLNETAANITLRTSFVLMFF